MLPTTQLPGTTWHRPRSSGAAVALWLLFGTFGIHRAYLNRQYWLAMFLTGFTGWGGVLLSWSAWLVGDGPAITPSLAVGCLLLPPILLVWIIDFFRLFGWVADHNVTVGRAPR